MSEIRTEAGKRLLDKLDGRPGYVTPAAVAAIESEAIAAERARLAAAVDGLSDEEWRDCSGNCHGETILAILTLLEPTDD